MGLPALKSELAMLSLVSCKASGETVGQPIKASFNPSSLTLSRDVKYSVQRGEDDPGTRTRYVRTEPGELGFELQFADTGAQGIMPVIRQLYLACFSVDDGESGGRRLVKVSWGGMDWLGEPAYVGRAHKLTVRYTQFGRTGTPLCASASVLLVAR